MYQKLDIHLSALMNLGKSQMMQDIYQLFVFKNTFQKRLCDCVDKQWEYQCRITSFDLYKNPVFTKFDSLCPVQILLLVQLRFAKLQVKHFDWQLLV